MANLGNILKQAQEMQAQINRLQEELVKTTFETSVGGGMVVAIVNGKSEVISLKIEKDIIKSEDTEMLQDLIITAINQSIRKSKQMATDKMSKITGGLNIPPDII